MPTLAGVERGWEPAGIQAVRERCKKTGLIRTPNGSRPLRGTHKVKGGMGKSMTEMLSLVYWWQWGGMWCVALRCRVWRLKNI